MTPMEKMRAMAEKENIAARRTWGLSPQSRLAGEIEKFIGSGLTEARVAKRIGCTQGAVNYILKSRGWKL